MTMFRFTLYVAGDGSRSRLAIANLHRLLGERLRGRAEFEIVDVQKSPEHAESARILTTPTLVKESPEPRRRVTGDLSNSDLVFRALSPLDEARRVTRAPIDVGTEDDRG
jgi:circadian clock protein KaiB